MPIERRSRSRHQRRTRVLVVSHDATVRSVLHRTLRRWDVDITAVDDAFAALAALAELNGTAGSLAVAVVDTHLPGLSGWDLLTFLRITSPETSLLRLQTSGTEVPPEFARLGVSVLTKPVQPGDLIRAVGRLLT